MGKPQGTSANIWTYAAQGDTANLQRLLAAGEPVDLQNKAGESAAHVAARHGQAQVLTMLAAHGANLLLPDGQGRAAAHLAAAAGQLECLRALARLGCRLDVKDAQAQTPLDVAKGDGVRKFLVNWIAEAKTSRRFQAHPPPPNMQQQQQQQVRGKPAQNQSRLPQRAGAARAAGGSDDEADDEGRGCSSATLKPQPQQQQQQQQRRPKPAATMDYHSSKDIQQQQQQGGVDGEGRPQKAAPSNQPLRWAELESVGSGSERLPRCTLEEAGFTPLGLSLGMPKRPAWRGIVRSAAELHALEEQSFAAWQSGLQSLQLPVSFYEPRLEFWRQLWRVLELADIVVMIVDARNPLLHFSHALTRHIIDDHGATPLLVLNKSDLVPAEALQAWSHFFERRYPQLKVVVASTRTAGAGGAAGAAVAAPGAPAAVALGAAAAAAAGRTGAGGSVNRGAAAAILAAALDCSVQRQGGRVKVSDIVGSDIHAILDEAQQRSTMSKRAPAATTSAIRHAAAAAAAPAGPGPASATAAGSGGSDGGGGGDSSSGGEGSGDGAAWMVHGKKASKKLALKKKRNKRMVGVRPQQQQQQQHHPQPQTQPRPQPKHQQQKQAQPAEELSSGEEDDGGAAEGSEGSGGESSGGRSSGADGCVSDVGEDELRRRQEAEAEEVLRSCEEAAAAPQGSGGSHPQRPAGGRPSPSSSAAAASPVVICMVGEPNVGKSSTLNSLLGTHRVAVSSHPGRTKHYQTHYMTDRLMLCDCPGLVFPRTGVSLPMQILFGSYPIARCRDPYSVVSYLAERLWPRLHVAMGLRKPRGDGDEGGGGGEGEGWSTEELLTALAVRKSWVSRQGRLDLYRAANWVLRAALAGRPGTCLAFLPPAEGGVTPDQAQQQ